MNGNRIAATVAVIAFVIAVGVGLYLAGSPSEQRLARFDKQRIADLVQIRNAINEYWQTNRSLPARVDEDVIGLALPRVPRDPEYDTGYEYEVVGNEAYRLCADFDRESAAYLADEFWAHDAGRQCFTFEVSEPADRN